MRNPRQRVPANAVFPPISHTPIGPIEESLRRGEPRRRRCRQNVTLCKVSSCGLMTCLEAGIDSLPYQFAIHSNRARS